MALTAIRIDGTKKELDAIREYAIMCDEPVSDLVLKIIIQEITLMKSHYVEDPEMYSYSMRVPEGISYAEEQKIIEANYNKIRDILGWKQIRMTEHE